MTVKARVVAVRHRLEWIEHSRIGRRYWQGCDRERFVWLMTDRAVVVIGRLIVHRSGERCDDESNARSGRDRVLMFVVRKFDRELAFVFWLHLLVRIVRPAKRKPGVFTRSGAYVTHRTNRRTRSDHRLSGKELRTMTAHTRVVIRKIGDVGKCALRIPRSRNPVTSIALKALVLVR